jgi:hypothetical protein
LSIPYYIFCVDGSLNNTFFHDHYLLDFNASTYIWGGMLCLFLTEIRYKYLKKLNEIHDKINDMDTNKRERLDTMTVLYMVASPFLLFFFASYVRDMYK